MEPLYNGHTDPKAIVLIGPYFRERIIAERLSARLLIMQCSRLAFVCICIYIYMYICMYIYPSHFNCVGAVSVVSSP